MAFYGYGYHFVLEGGLTESDFIQANLSAIERSERDYQLVREWEVEPEPMSERPLTTAPPPVQDNRAAFRYSGVGDTEIDGFGLNKRIGPYYYFVRLDVCAHKRETDRDEVVSKMFDSLANSGFGGYWLVESQ